MWKILKHLDLIARRGRVYDMSQLELDFSVNFLHHYSKELLEKFKI